MNYGVELWKNPRITSNTAYNDSDDSVQDSDVPVKTFKENADLFA